MNVMRIFTTASYEKSVKRLLKSEEQDAMENAIAADPQAHPVISGTGGIRKARWAREGGGKSGGLRVIYYYLAAGGEVHFLFVYGKNDQADLTADQRKKFKKYVEAL